MIDSNSKKDYAVNITVMGFMPSSAEIWVLNKINDLTARFGLDPMDFDVGLTLCNRREGGGGPHGGCFYTVGLVPRSYNDETDERIAKISSLLGLSDLGYKEVETLYELNDAIDRALSFAPRVRTR